MRPIYVVCEPDPRMSQQVFWLCTVVNKAGIVCGQPTYSHGDAIAHWTEKHMPKRPKRKAREKKFSRYSAVIGMDKGDYRP